MGDSTSVVTDQLGRPFEAVQPATTGSAASAAAGMLPSSDFTPEQAAMAQLPLPFRNIIRDSFVPDIGSTAKTTAYPQSLIDTIRTKGCSSFRVINPNLCYIRFRGAAGPDDLMIEGQGRLIAPGAAEVFSTQNAIGAPRTQLRDRRLMGARTQGLGMPGRNAELRVSDGYIQWRQEGTAWSNLVALSAITPAAQPGKSAYEVAVAAGYSGSAADWLVSLIGASGKSAEMRTTATAIQWRQTGGVWADLITLAAIIGPAGFVLAGTVTVGQTGLVLAGGIREVTAALAGTVVGERYSFFARSYTLNGGASVKGRPTGYSIIDCVCNVAGQITISINAPALTVLTGYTITGDVLRVNAT
jgi:hypothetical protein